MSFRSETRGPGPGDETCRTQRPRLKLIAGGTPAAQTPERIDPRVLDKLFSLGGERLVFQLLDLFASAAPARIEAIRHGTESGDLDDVERQAHALKSSAGNLGAKGMAALCQSIEATSGRARHAEPTERAAALRAIREWTHELQQEMARVGPHFARLRAKGRG